MPTRVEMADASTRVLLVALLCLSGCAKVSAPSGGPIDKTPPHIASTVPTADRTSVAAGSPILITFSEAMDPRATQEAVFIAPATPMKMVWDSSRILRLVVKGGLAAQRTYVITLGTDAKDRRGNRLASSEQFAFSTGEVLDQGTMVGRVVSTTGPHKGVTVWVYDLEHLKGKVGEDDPAYVTQTGNDGHFRFDRLSSTRYRLLAFVDEDRNRLLGGSEARAVASADVEVTETDTTFAGDMYLADAPAMPILERITAVDRRRLLLVFDRQIEADRVEVEIDGLDVIAIYSAEDAKRVYVHTDAQLPGHSYRPAIRIDGQVISIKAANGGSDQLRGSSRADSRSPKIVQTQPAAKAIQVDELSFIFDEAMLDRVPTATFWHAQDSTQVVVGEWMWRDLFQLVYVLSDPLQPGKTKLHSRWPQIADMAGNPPADSVLVEVEVLTEEDRPLLEVELDLSPWIDSSPVRIVASTQPEQYLLQTEDLTGTRQLPPGQYHVYGFVDEDLDGQHDPGAMDPFRLAEPFGWAGTVDLRASTTTRAKLTIY